MKQAPISNFSIKELFIYALVAVSALTIMGFSVHMLVGGLVNQTTEYAIIVGVCFAGALAIAYMAWDVVRRRQRGGG
ncbi:MAG TPA: hypothetical protein VJM76_00665 [Gammaproteobacteria bacterium]|nr:hypothetical protein [Gammaproteobacteria bacterium]